MPTISVSAESTGRSILPLACYRKQLREPSHCRIHRFDAGLGKAGQDLGQGIEHQFEIIRNTLTSIPGIGKVYSAGIVAEIGKDATPRSGATMTSNQQIPAQTRTRFNCQKTDSVDLSTAEGQPPVYPIRELGLLLAALTPKPCF